MRESAYQSILRLAARALFLRIADAVAPPVNRETLRKRRYRERKRAEKERSVSVPPCPGTCPTCPENVPGHVPSVVEPAIKTALLQGFNSSNDDRGALKLRKRKGSPLHELKNNTASQVETAARDGAFEPGPRDAGLTPKQRKRYHWAQNTLSYGWSVLPTQQIIELMTALTDELLIEWVSGRAELPSWAKHSLEALHKRRRPTAVATNDPLPALPLPITGNRREDAA